MTDAAAASALSEIVIPPADALAEFPRLQATPEDAATLAHGNPVPAWEAVTDGEFVSVLAPDGRLLGVAEVMTTDEAVLLQPRRILLGSDEL